jgi:methyltransferase (TIGR00027 family)
MREHQASTTAQIVTFIRAALSLPEGGSLLDDMYAGCFLRQPYARLLKTLQRPLGPLFYRALGYSTGAVGNVCGRTRFFDEQMRQAIEQGATQVVILGAGYDTRALRLQRQGVRFFEVDHPATQADKRGKLASLGLSFSPIFVAVDFTKDDLVVELQRAGFSPAQKTFFLWEGVTMYLSEAETNHTLAALGTLAAPGSLLAFDVNTQVRPSLFHRVSTALRSVAVSWFGEPWKLWMTAGMIPRILQGGGWSLKRLLRPEEIIEFYLAGTGLVVPPNKFLVLAEV